MLRFTHKAENVLHYEVHGTLNAAELRSYYATVDAHFRRFGKLRLLVHVHGFNGFAGLRALLVFARHEPGLLRRIDRYAAVADQGWFRRTINAADVLVPIVQLRAFRSNQSAEAAKWLADQMARTQDAEKA